MAKFNVAAPSPATSSLGCNQRRRPQSARACLEQRIDEVNPSDAGSVSYASKADSHSKRRPQSAIAHTSSSSRTISRASRRPQSFKASEKRFAEKDHLTVEDAHKILAVLRDAKQRQEDQTYPVSVPELAPPSSTGVSESTPGVLRSTRGVSEFTRPQHSQHSVSECTRGVSEFTRGVSESTCPRCRGVSESTRASTFSTRSSDAVADLYRMPREWVESVRGTCTNSHKSSPYYSYGERSTKKSRRSRSACNDIRNVLDDQGAGSPTTHLTPALWHLQTGPERALWGRHKKAHEHGNYLFDAGAWADRMGTGSIIGYKQWGPSGPQFAIDATKLRK